MAHVHASSVVDCGQVKPKTIKLIFYCFYAKYAALKTKIKD